MHSPLLLSITLILLSPYSSAHLLFVLDENRPTCFIEELFEKSVLIMKYKIYTKSHQKVDSLLPYVKIEIKYEDKGKILYSETVRSAKEKTSFLSQGSGLYRICVYRKRYSGAGMPTEEVYMNMRFASDNMDRVELQGTINKNDLNNLQKKTRKVISMTTPIIQNQKSNLQSENTSSVDTLANTKWYKYMTFGQVVVTLIIGLVQLNNFRRFLKSQNIISD